MSQNKTAVQFEIQKRDGRNLHFEPQRIGDAITAAFRAQEGLEPTQPLGQCAQEVANQIAGSVVAEVEFAAKQTQGLIDVERIQDLVETALMEAGEYAVARRYIVYRVERNRARLLRGQAADDRQPQISVRHEDGQTRPLDLHQIKRRLYEACHGLKACDAGALMADFMANIYDGLTERELNQAMVMVARQRIERDPQYQQVATRLMLALIYQEVLETDAASPSPSHRTQESAYASSFKANLLRGVRAKRIDKTLLDFDLDRLAQALEPARDLDFQYLGIQTLYDRYLLHIDEQRIETPQTFWMRVAMGLSLKEDDREARAIEFYELLSTFRFLSATPTLFNSGTCHAQMSSCYLTSIDDDLGHIFKSVRDNALLSKWAGGLGNDWTRVRASGARIHGTNGASQGVIPFLKVANDTALAVNQGGKRKGAVCAYLETWHLDIEEFLELRKNTGDDRRRTHDMHTANWIPDLFMTRVREEGDWTLFSPDDTPDLHETFGQTFNTAYERYEELARTGSITHYKTVKASELWRKMLSMLFETGHPWITFKDPSNIRSPQDHAGVVHNSNLCTEILLNTSNDETAVCNLGSINLKKHTREDGVDFDLLANTVKTAMRMLDNVIDINYYPTDEAKNANLKHRPVGLGMMGCQDALYIQRMANASQEAIDFADTITEFIAYHAILNSSQLAAERGAYQSFAGSKWDRGLLPLDTLALLKESRNEGEFDQNNNAAMDWAPVRESIAAHGMRNANTMAIAPTATISNIAGCCQSIEPTYRNLYVKSNLSGDFTIVNEYLVADLKALNLWDDAMIDDLKYHDGELAELDRIPDELKKRYQTAFEVEADCLIETISRRQKWIDMGISFNLYLAKPSGRALSEMYTACWEKGLKTTYYLRSLAATQIEKTSIDVNARGAQPKWMKSRSDSADVIATPQVVTVPKACSILEPDCEACQ